MKFTDDNRTSIQHSVNTTLEHAHRLNPAKGDIYAMYSSAIPDDVMEVALKLHAMGPKQGYVLNSAANGLVYLAQPNVYNRVALRFLFGRSMPVSAKDLDIGPDSCVNKHPDQQVRFLEVMLPWLRAEYELSVRILRTRELLHFVSHECNTPGQIMRVWPEIVPFLSGPMQQVIGNASRASRLPKGFKLDTLTYKTDCTELIATCSLLKSDDQPKVLMPFMSSDTEDLGRFLEAVVGRKGAV